MDLEMKSTDHRSEQSVPDTTIAIGYDDPKMIDANDNQPLSCAVDIGDDKGEVEIGEDENHQRVCRICLLSAKESGKSPIHQLMDIGCGCQGELGVAHSHCAEAWFKVRGIRLCEICGEMAKNITGVGDTSVFMEEWNENGSVDTTLRGSTDGDRRCLRWQPLCNFLVSCLVIAFVLPWFFRVNIF